jgi:hypothetical protein
VNRQIEAVEAKRAAILRRASELARARGLKVERVAAEGLRELRRIDPRYCPSCCEPLAEESLGETHAKCEQEYWEYRERRQQAMLADSPWPLVDLIRSTL